MAIRFSDWKRRPKFVALFVRSTDMTDRLVTRPTSPSLPFHSIYTFPLRRSGDRRRSDPLTKFALVRFCSLCVAKCQSVFTTPTHFRSAPSFPPPLSPPSLPLCYPALECFVLPLAISAFSLSDGIQGWANVRSKLLKGRSRGCQFQYDVPCSEGFSISPILQHLPFLPSLLPSFLPSFLWRLLPPHSLSHSLARVLLDTLPCSPPLV